MIAWLASKRANNTAQVESPLTADEAACRPDAIDRAIAFLLGKPDVVLAQGGVTAQSGRDAVP